MPEGVPIYVIVGLDLALHLYGVFSAARNAESRKKIATLDARVTSLSNALDQVDRDRISLASFKAEVADQIALKIDPIGKRLDAQDARLTEIVDLLTSRPT